MKDTVLKDIANVVGVFAIHLVMNRVLNEKSKGEPENEGGWVRNMCLAHIFAIVFLFD